MKSQSLTSISFLSLVSFTSLFAALLTGPKSFSSELGTVDISGNSCIAELGSHELQYSEKNQTFILPTAFYLKKEENTGLARGTCNFALTLNASNGKRIQVVQRHQFLSLRAYPKDTNIRFSSEIFKVGSRGTTETLAVSSSEKMERLNTFLEKNEIIAETTCGGSTILRGNFSATAMGTGKARVFLDDLQLTIVESVCQE